MKYRKRCAWAVEVIHKYYLGWLVRQEYRHKFRAVAGPKIVKFLQNWLVSFILILCIHILNSVYIARSTDCTYVIKFSLYVPYVTKLFVDVDVRLYLISLICASLHFCWIEIFFTLETLKAFDVSNMNLTKILKYI